jgi:hypothetical protein
LAFIHDGKLHLYRRQSRPLFIGELGDNKLFYSSRMEGLFQIGCRYVQNVIPERMNIFKAGKLIDSEPVRKSRLHYLKDGVLPGSWEYDVKEDHKKYYPEVWRPVVKKPIGALPATTMTSSRSSAGTTQRGTDNRTQTQGRSLISQVSTVTNPSKVSDLFEYLEMDILEHSEAVQIPNGNAVPFDKYYESGDSESAFVVLSLKDSVNEAPLSNWTVGFKGNKDTYTITTGRGLAVIQLSDKYFRHLKSNDTVLQLIAVDPFNYKQYYTKDITITRGRVVEGTLLVPFRTKEKAQKTPNFRTMADNLISRAFLYQRVVQTLNGESSTGPVISTSETDGSRGDGGSTTGSSSEDTASQTERIGRALAVDLLLSHSCGSEVFKSAQALAGNIREPKRLYEKISKQSEQEKTTETSSQSVSVVGDIKDTDFTPVGKGKTNSGILAIDFEKKETMDALMSGFITDCEESGVPINRVQKFVNGNIKMVTVTKPKPVWLKEDTEEQHIVGLINTLQDMENKASVIIEALQQAGAGVGWDADDYRKVITDSMADAIVLGHSISDELEKYKKIASQQDFLPF